MRKDISIIIGIIILIAGLVLVSRLDFTKSIERPKAEVSGLVQKTGPNFNLDLPAYGNPSAPVRIIEFGDYQCGFCKRFFEETEPLIRKEFVDTGLVVLYWKDFAFLGQESFDAAVAARCAAEQGKFWEYHDLLLSSQTGENFGNFSKENLKRFAVNLGLQTSSFAVCLDNNKYLNDVIKSTQEGRNLGVRGTPATFVGQQFIEGAYPYDYFKQAIEKELKKIKTQ